MTRLWLSVVLGVGLLYSACSDSEEPAGPTPDPTADITRTIPDQGATGVTREPVVEIIFSKILSNTGSADAWVEISPDVPLLVVREDSILRIGFAVPLEILTEYQITVTGVQFTSGWTMTTPHVLTFETENKLSTWTRQIGDSGPDAPSDVIEGPAGTIVVLGRGATVAHGQTMTIFTKLNLRGETALDTALDLGVVAGAHRILYRSSGGYAVLCMGDPSYIIELSADGAIERTMPIDGVVCRSFDFDGVGGYILVGHRRGYLPTEPWREIDFVVLVKVSSGGQVTKRELANGVSGGDSWASTVINVANSGYRLFAADCIDLSDWNTYEYRINSDLSIGGRTSLADPSGDAGQHDWLVAAAAGPQSGYVAVGEAAGYDPCYGSTNLYVVKRFGTSFNLNYCWGRDNYGRAVDVTADGGCVIVATEGCRLWKLADDGFVDWKLHLSDDPGVDVVALSDGGYLAAVHSSFNSGNIELIKVDQYGVQ